MKNIKLRGHFVITVPNYIDHQYGEGDYGNPWCVSTTRYCKATSVSKLRKFDSYEEAQEYIDAINLKHKKDRDFEIMYLISSSKNNCWYNVFSTADAFKIDSKH